MKDILLFVRIMGHVTMENMTDSCISIDQQMERQAEKENLKL